MIAAAASGLVAAACFVAATVSTGSGLGLCVTWLLVVALGIVLPGVLVVRATRGRIAQPAAAETDLAWGCVAGLLLALLAWLAGRLIDVRLPQVAVGLAVAAVLMIVPATRHRITQRGAGSWGWPARLLVGAAVLVGLRLATTTGLSWVPPHVVDGAPMPSPDLLYHVALTGELRRTLTPDYPMVAGTPLHYHWLYYALAAQLGGDGSDDVEVTLRLLPASLLCLLVLVCAAVAVVVARRRSAAAAAALMVAAVGPVGASLWATPGPFPAVANPAVLWPVGTYWLWSPTQTLGWVLGVAGLGLVVARVRRGPGDVTVPTWMLLPVFVGAAGAKSVQNPLLAALLAGAGLYLLARARRDRSARPPLVRLAVVAVTLVAATTVVALLMYPDAYGMRLAPGESVGYLVRTITPGLAEPLLDVPSPPYAAPLAASVTAVLLRLGPTLLTVVGIAGFFVGARDATARRALGCGAVALAAAGVAGHMLLVHPGRSEWFLLVGAVPLLTTLAAAGAAPVVVDVARAQGWRHPPGLVHPSRPSGIPRRWAALPRARVGLTSLVVAAVVAAVVTLVVSVLTGPADPLARWSSEFGTAPTSGQVGVAEQAWAWLGPWLAVVGGVGAAVALAVATSRGLRGLHGGARVPPGSVMVAAAAVAVVAAGFVPVARLTAPGADPYPQALRDAVASADAERGLPALTAALERAAGRIRHDAAPDDVVATNRVFLTVPPAVGIGGDSRDFSVSALSGRRTDVGGFGYAGRMVETSARERVAYPNVPFWDPARLEAQRLLVQDPTAGRVLAAWDRGIRWVLADERSGRVSQSLPQWCDTVVVDDRVHVCQLRPPAR